MRAGDRFKAWLEQLAQSWKVPLGGWMASWVNLGLKTLLEGFEPEIISSTREVLTDLANQKDLPPAYKTLINKSIKTGDVFTVVLGWAYTIIGLIPAAFGLGRPLGNLLNYAQELVHRTYRLQPAEVITAWRRDPLKYEKYFEDLREQGWSEDRILALRFYSQTFPNVQDIIRFAVREAYTPDIAEKFGQYEDLPTAAAADLQKVGYPWEEFKKQWASHWGLPSTSDGFEMLHRGVIDEETLRMLLRAADVMPYWRDKLIAISWRVPTRVDVRRFYDLKTIDEARLREIYTAMGYHDKDLDDYVLWTKVYVGLPDLLARWKNGWLTLDELKAQLQGLGMSAENAEELLQTKVSAVQSEVVAEERNLVRTDIIKGVSKGIISYGEGQDLLQQLGYSSDQAKFILDVNVAPEDEVEEVVKEKDLTKTDILNAVAKKVIPYAEGRQMLVDLGYSEREATVLLLVKLGLTDESLVPQLLGSASPANLEGFQKVTKRFQIVSGQEAKIMPEELKTAAAELVRLTGEIKELDQAIKDEKAKLVEEEPRPASAEKHLKELQVARNRAIAEKDRVQLEYNTRLAEWRHGVK